METGKSLGYSLFNLQERGTLIIGPAVDVYVGMIVGINNRDNDLNVNPCKIKKCLTQEVRVVMKLLL